MEEPVIAQKGPYAVEVEAGKQYYWCRCGRSNNQPFCDGSHAGTGISPMAFTANRTDRIFLCGCKHSSDQPYCDGSHSRLK
jgi:CDGSH-type Zn-finger protein